ncbi:hypothetical protein HYDPIDRAFT_177475 [Hydnomerulius pinastri MD-312]|uniref:Uncharacterized protein n=1 Tax=Hydnomerulius pinastri MD-312 TaxID=994086 RepID=A0A0C9WA44_9AGAM|nr:hypothetical protein HYDPIDRAFT_177475 [Hydnomerulius pinastri MD-312]
MDLNNPRDAAIFACIVVTFYCVARLGEFTVSAITKFNPAEHITNANFHLPRTKCAPDREDTQCAPLDCLTDPVAALDNHLTINGTANPGDYLGMLHYFLKGTPFDVVKSIGRWAGDSFTIYLRQHAVILALYLHNCSEIMDWVTRYTMPPMCWPNR